MPSLHASPLAPDGTSVPSNPSAQLGSAAALASGTRLGSASLSTSTTHCFHCGQPLGRDVTPLVADIGGQRRTFCCGGCQALAQTLYSAGFGHLYSDVTRFARPIDAQARREAEPVWAAYDTPELRNQFVRELGDGRAEITLAPENIRCAACAWLIEQHLGQLDGVESAVANVATRRVVVRWQENKQGVAGLLSTLADIGYQAWPFEVSRGDQHDRRERRGLLMRMAVAMLGMMQVMMYAWPLYTHEATIDPGQLQLMRWASFALTIPVVLYSASPIFAGAWRSLRQRHMGMDVPVAIGVLAGFFASAVATVRGVGEVYFDSVTMFVAFLLLARYLELRVRQASRSGAEMLARQLPATCERLVETSGVGERIPVARLNAGDRIRVKAGEIMPADGVVVAGVSEIDESMLTGEARPVKRAIGDTVLAGCFNAASPLEVSVRRIGAQTRLAEIVAVLDRALADKPRLAQLADRVAGWFVATLLILAAITGLVWAIWIDPSRALLVTVAVLVVSCPCALSLATPAALAAAGAALSRRGVLLTRAHTLEALSGVTDIMLDKTGTLTEGRFALVSTEIAGNLDAPTCQSLAAAMERGGEHPIARALVEAAADHAERLVAELHNTPGQGLQANVDGRLMRLGRREFVAELAPAAADIRRSGDRFPGATEVWLGDANGPLACFQLADVERPQTAELLASLTRLGVRCHLVSGDQPAAVRWWADRFGIETAVGAVTPEGKRDYVANLQQQGAVVLAVGDGINDAPVLAQAQVSIAIGSGAPLAQAGADAVLTHGGVGEIANAIAVARKTRRVVRQNLGWAFFYNVVAIPLAATGLVTAWMAGIGMSVSSLLVVGNAWRLLRAAAAPARES
ncbi:heavy metal translocating P-type ATPase [Cupriavidus metallidurans]|uniref:Heavy metal transporting P-type ATPase n=1 Tax=Cupriavidus metallidurans (strain ATCC 43123 / DSM 2839 / NBRC 102507 / CH34) TaxID=266264 RepID=Q1LLQ1_CUPMC|nr:heavy metal translocating P-type ATPase [Cupriavidus metallidurans]ABF08925.1 heavy metal transporting P-type ATPase [Cupriavidus metallidurans CH34]QGS30173.1 heavy metal translocating P-type ATPase [Cupriavidus metallidurans]